MREGGIVGLQVGDGHAAHACEQQVEAHRRHVALGRAQPRLVGGVGHHCETEQYALRPRRLLARLVHHLVAHQPRIRRLLRRNAQHASKLLHALGDLARERERRP